MTVTQNRRELSTEEIRRRVLDVLLAAGVEDQINSPYPKLTENAKAVLERRYLSRDRDGKIIEDYDGMFRRVARNLSQADLNYGASETQRQATEDKFFEVMRRLEFLPNSPTLMNAGRDLQQLSACFVLPVSDSLDSIFNAVKQTALIHKSGGGTGFSFSRLRPSEDVVGSTGGVASGPVSFIRAFDTATDVVKQGGTRRGANMGILNVEHPDILKFIHSKEDGKNLSNFNISVAINEDFMERAMGGKEYDLINPRTGRVSGQLDARKVFDQIVEMAWKTGDPGLVFLDRINRDNPNPQLGKIESTNPCGEQPLLPYESCNLGSVNLARLVRFDDNGAAIDWQRLAQVVHVAVHVLDNVIDMNRYPIREIEEMTKATRRIGVGLMGFADLLVAMGIRYDSEEALRLGEEVMRHIKEETYKASVELAESRGVFSAWEGSIYNRPGNVVRMRNSAPVTIAPTGTISIIAGASSGIEPLFALSYVRNVMDRTRLVEVNQFFEAVAKQEGFYSPDLMLDLAEKGTLAEMNGQVPQWVKEVFRVSHDITPEWHVRIQAAFQKHTDNAVSKTINFPHDATVADIAEAYQLAYKLGCKGITVYRDSSKAEQVLSTGSTAKHALSSVEGNSQGGPAEAEAPVPAEATLVGTGEGHMVLTPRQRPRTTRGLTERVRTGHGNMYVTINFDQEGRPFELFGTLGKAGGCDSAQLEAISRLVSLALRSGIGTQEVVSQLRGITCCPAWDNGTLVHSSPDAVALALERNLVQDEGDPAALPTEVQMKLIIPAAGGWTGATSDNNNGIHQGKRCPDCNNDVIFQEGCLMCVSCGWNKCE